MNSDLHTCLHVLESGSVDEEALRLVLYIFFKFSQKTEEVVKNRSAAATVYCRILSICQKLYDIDDSKKLPEEIKNQLVRCFENIERLFLDTDKEQQKGTYVRTIWFLSELKSKAAAGRSAEISKQLIGEHASDLLEILGDIRFVFDIEYEGRQLFPISRVIAAVISGYDFQQFKSGIQISDIYTLYLAVRLFQTPEDTGVLEKLKAKCNLQFINYLSNECHVIDTVDFLNYQYNGTIIFYNDSDKKVLIRSEHEDYFTSGGLTYTIHPELDCDGNKIGWFIEYNLDIHDQLCDYSDILRTEEGRQVFLKLVYDAGYRNVFLEKSLVRKSDGTIIPINPYCRKDTRLVQGYLRKTEGKTYKPEDIRLLLQKYRICPVKSNVINRVSFGLCILLLELDNTGVDALGLSSLEETDWYQAQVIQNWLSRQEVGIDDIKRLLLEWYDQLRACEKTSLIQQLELKPMDFYPLKQNLERIYQKIIPEQGKDEKLYSGIVEEDDDEPETYLLKVTVNTVAGKRDKKSGILPSEIQAACLQRDEEAPKWDQRIGSEEFFLYSITEKRGRVLSRELLKALAGVELQQANCLDPAIGLGITGTDYNAVRDRMMLYNAVYCEVARSTKACLPEDLDSQTYLRLLYNMIWSKIDTKEKKEAYFGIFMAHQIAAFDEIGKDDVFCRKTPNVLYIPKDNIAQSSVLSNIFEKRLKAEAQRDTRHLYITELTKTDDGRFSVYGETIEKILFLTDNMASGRSTIAALAAQFGIEEDTEFGISRSRVKQADATRHKYSCEKHEVSIAEVLRANNARIAVHAYYGTEDARRNINNFLRKYDIPFEESTYCRRLSRKADKSIVDCAKSIWGEGNVKIPPFHYLYVREYNMPKSSIFPAAMLKNPKLMINLLFQNDELNHITN